MTQPTGKALATIAQLQSAAAQVAYLHRDNADLRRQLEDAQHVAATLDAARAAACAEAADLRRQLDAVPVACICNVVLDVANNAEWRMVREWLKTYDAADTAIADAADAADASPATGEGE